MKTTVTLRTYTHFNGKYINGGSRLDRFDERCDRDSFDEYLYRGLKDYQKSEWCKPWLKLLSSEMEKQTFPKDPTWLEEIFEDYVSINIDFAKNLHRLDVMRNACFKNSTLLGDAILNLTKELTFIVDRT